jgi:hypothetical protein
MAKKIDCVCIRGWEWGGRRRNLVIYEKVNTRAGAVKFIRIS